MKNSITASIEFSFKGKRFRPAVTLNLDEKSLCSKDIPELYRLIASTNNIDLYSYEYEVMESTPIIFSDAQGLITDFVNNGALDITAFEAAWQEKIAIENVSAIAKQHLAINKLDEHPELKHALVAAYLKGRADRNG